MSYAADERVEWLQKPSPYAAPNPVSAVVVRSTGKRVLIRTERDGKQTWVRPGSLRRPLPSPRATDEDVVLILEGIDAGGLGPSDEELAARRNRRGGR